MSVSFWHMFHLRSLFPARRHLSLRLSLLFSVVVPLVLLSAVAVVVSLGFVERGLENRLQEDVQLVARAIRLPVSRGLARNEPARIEEALKSAFSIHRVYGAYVYDMNGRRVAAAGDVTPKRAQLDMLRLAKRDQRAGEYDEIGGRKVYSYFVPLSDSGNRIVGLLQVTRRRTDFVATMTRLRIGAAIVVLSMLAVIAAVVLAGHRRAIGRHLSALANVMREVREGERERRATDTGPREIAGVAGALNSMLDSIAAAEREIISRRQSEENLARRLRQSEKLATLGRFSAGIAHELGGPLSVIDGKARRVLRKGADANKTEVEAIRGEVERADRVIRQILELARHGASRRRVMSCERLVHAAVAAVRDDAQAAGVEFRVLAGPDLCRVNVEPMRIRQALVNLLQNALIAAPGGQVELSWESAGSWVRFLVADSGSGIAPGMREQVFEPFFTTRQDVGGTGMGLALTQGIVLDHDGHLEVIESRLGGACFRIELPAVESEA